MPDDGSVTTAASARSTEEGGQNAVTIKLSAVKVTCYLLTLQLGVGILGLPSVFHTLGVAIAVPAVVVVALMSYGTGLLFYQYQKEDDSVRSAFDVGFSLYKRTGREIVLYILVTYQCFVCSAGLIMTRLALEIMTGKAICSIVYSALAALVFFLLSTTLPYRRLGFLGICSLIGLLGVILTVVAIGIKRTGFQRSRLILIGADVRPFVIFTGLTNLVFLFSGAALFIPVMSANDHFPQAFATTWTLLTIIFLLIGILGLGAVEQQPRASLIVDNLIHDHLARKILWGFCIAVAMIGSPANGQAAILLLCDRFFGSPKAEPAIDEEGGRSGANSFGKMWSGLCYFSYQRRHDFALGAIFWTLAFFIAESIPYFSPLLGLIASIFVAFLNYMLPGFAWLQLWRRKHGKTVDASDKDEKVTAAHPTPSVLSTARPSVSAIITSLALGSIVYAFALMGSGVYANVTTILHLTRGSTGSKTPFRCE